MPRPFKSGNGKPTPGTSLRISERARFAMHLLARQNDDMSDYTKVMERAIEELAEARLSLDAHWRVLYDEEPAVRMLNAFAQTRYRPSKDEDELLTLIRAFPRFWYSDDAQKVPRRDYASVLWPHRKRYLELWRKRGNNFRGAAEAMAADLKKAKLEPPKVSP